MPEARIRDQEMGKNRKDENLSALKEEICLQDLEMKEMPSGLEIELGD